TRCSSPTSRAGCSGRLAARNKTPARARVGQVFDLTRLRHRGRRSGQVRSGQVTDLTYANPRYATLAWKNARIRKFFLPFRRAACFASDDDSLEAPAPGIRRPLPRVRCDGPGRPGRLRARREADPGAELLPLPRRLAAEIRHAARHRGVPPR